MACCQMVVLTLLSNSPFTAAAALVEELYPRLAPVLRLASTMLTSRPADRHVSEQVSKQRVIVIVCVCVCASLTAVAPLQVCQWLHLTRGLLEKLIMFCGPDYSPTLTCMDLASLVIEVLALAASMNTFGEQLGPDGTQRLDLAVVTLLRKYAWQPRAGTDEDVAAGGRGRGDGVGSDPEEIASGIGLDHLRYRSRRQARGSSTAASGRGRRDGGAGDGLGAGAGSGAGAGAGRRQATGGYMTSDRTHAWWQVRKRLVQVRQLATELTGCVVCVYVRRMFVHCQGMSDAHLSLSCPRMVLTMPSLEQSWRLERSCCFVSSPTVVHGCIVPVTKA